MSLRDLSIIFLICLIWAGHTVVSKVVVSGMEIPPLFYAVLRYGCVCLFVFPWLFPLPRPMWRMVVISLLMGALGFSLFFSGIKTATPSAAAVVLQIGIPLTTILSVLVLGEVIRWRRRVGIVLTFAGVMIVMWNPAGFIPSAGLLMVAGSGICGAFGVILMKQMVSVRPMQFQAWGAFLSLPPMMLMTWWFEKDQIPQAIQQGWAFAAALAFSVIVVSLLSHNLYFRQLQKHDANLLAPLMLLNPLIAILLGIWITDDPFDLRMAIGAGIALLGVLIISMRPNSKVRMTSLQTHQNP